ncbi:MAG: serine/threonine protein kinase [Polyangiaceae bacterium]|nr:serine/threonine protein kinase [Polyangiaceae bacterium]
MLEVRPKVTKTRNFECLSIGKPQIRPDNPPTYCDSRNRLPNNNNKSLADTAYEGSSSNAGSNSKIALSIAKLPGEGDLVGGLYRLIRLLGNGTFGKVYVAERIDVPEHQVALKLTLREAYSGRDVERELVMLAAAGHPHMIQLKDHGTTPHYVWFTMPVYDGETLAVRLRRGTLSVTEAHEVFVPIARSLEALHRAGLRHQDLKPDNVFLADFGGRVHPIILDLGVAAARTSGFVAGTLLFAAPEQTALLTGSEENIPLNEKMDTYGLASTLLLSLVGMDHFPGANAGTKEELVDAQRIRAESPIAPHALPKLTGLPRQLLDSAFKSWFAQDASVRPSMTEMADGLKVLLEQQVEEQKAEQRARARQKNKLFRQRFVIGILVSGALGLIGIGFAKRETFQIAAELQQARAEERQSFDNLQSCAAAQNNTRDRLRVSENRRARDLASYRESLDQLSKTGDRAKEESAAQLLACSNKLRTVEDEADTAARVCADNREQLVSSHQLVVTGITEERDAVAVLASDRLNQLVLLRRQNEQCSSELARMKADAAVVENPYVDPPQPGQPQPGPTQSGPPKSGLPQPDQDAAPPGVDASKVEPEHPHEDAGPAPQQSAMPSLQGRRAAQDPVDLD